jgi:hypothetical protein
VAVPREIVTGGKGLRHEATGRPATKECQTCG